MEDLCLHPKYVQPLREELAIGYGGFEKTAQGLPLLGSFIKESARMTPVESSELYLVPKGSFYKVHLSFQQCLCVPVSTRRCAT
jgi:hypothetical protein